MRGSVRYKRPETEAEWIEVIEFCAQFHSAEASARACNCSIPTLRAWLRRRPDLVRKRVASLIAMAEDRERALLKKLPGLSYGEVRHAVTTIDALRERWFVQSFAPLFAEGGEWAT